MHANARETALLQAPPAASRHEEEQLLSSQLHFFAQVAKLDGQAPATVPLDQPAPYASVRSLSQDFLKQSMQAAGLAAGSAAAQT